MQALELKIPPVIVGIAFATAIWLVSLVFPSTNYYIPASQTLALFLVFAGAVVALSGVVSFTRARTTVNPMEPEAATSLVVSGVYRITRNPMYLGLLLVLLGWTVFLGNPVALLLLPGFVLYMNRFQIIPEERALSAQFGDAFSDYVQRVRRWV